MAYTARDLLNAIFDATNVNISVGVNEALPAGTNAIGKLAANSGVDIGDVDVASIAAGTNTIGGTTDEGAGWTSSWTHTASADMTTAAALTAAPTTGQYIVVDDIIFSTDTAMNFTFEIETAGTDNVKIYCAANSAFQFTPRGKWKLATADKKLYGKASGAGNIAATVWYHSEA